MERLFISLFHKAQPLTGRTERVELHTSLAGKKKPWQTLELDDAERKAGSSYQTTHWEDAHAAHQCDGSSVVYFPSCCKISRNMFCSLLHYSNTTYSCIYVCNQLSVIIAIYNLELQMIGSEHTHSSSITRSVLWGNQAADAVVFITQKFSANEQIWIVDILEY